MGKKRHHRLPKVIEENEEKSDPVIVEVFSSPTCPHCPRAVRTAKRVARKFGTKVRFIHTDIGIGAGSRRAKSFKVMSVPTILIHCPEGEVLGHRGNPEDATLERMVRQALGEAAPVRASEGLLTRIKRTIVGD
ncbi:MAG: glutaredoxin domain-containing protein [Candidatus Undinarchaeales archaeon]|jgi:thiol-disulfide isomerase/thioredoxin|nr:glutaredoxin domain-containing protein [Candidatus Undinarchaeales archaeon]MDP7493595.1 glutaredoxin domain-containing protein [Candidatus Undinarchaeales archaeon]